LWQFSGFIYHPMMTLKLELCAYLTLGVLAFVISFINASLYGKLG
jgi:hypothetical protein